MARARTSVPTEACRRYTRPEAVSAGTMRSWRPCSWGAKRLDKECHWLAAPASLLKAPSWMPKPPGAAGLGIVEGAVGVGDSEAGGAVEAVEAGDDGATAAEAGRPSIAPGAAALAVAPMAARPFAIAAPPPD
jgi:hypothetical protein